MDSVMFKYQGHFDTYVFDETAKLPSMSDELIRFSCLNHEPYAFCLPLRNESNRFWVKTYGPAYSLIKETALHYNLRYVFFVFI